jgi:hypothetical protein
MNGLESRHNQEAFCPPGCQRACHELVQEIKAALLGNGLGANKGMIARLQAVERRTWWALFIVTTAGGIVSWKEFLA